MTTGLSGKTAVVTGGTQGIGAAVVNAFAATGAAVVFCARSEEPGRSLERRLADEGTRVLFHPADVSSEGEMETLMKLAAEHFGGIDILVTSAAVTASGSVATMPLETWQSVFDANVVGTFLACKHAIPYLKESPGGAIVNLGSTYGFRGVPNLAAYAATKAAVISLTKTLALELAVDGIRVNALCPGATDTPLTQDWLDTVTDAEAELATLRARHPLGRISTPEEQAAAAVFLASDDASFVTGHSLLVDGGYTAG